MTRKLTKRQQEELDARVKVALETMAAQEIYLLQVLQQAGELPLKSVATLGTGMVDVVDRLVASGEVTRYPGTIFGVSLQGERRLSGDRAV